MVSHSIAGSLGGLSKFGLEFREGHFDWVEVGAVGRQEAQSCTGVLNHLRDPRPLVAGQIVHYEDVTGQESRYKHAFDIDLEGDAIDRTGEPPMRNRSPLGARPWVRAMLVLAQVSSIKTRHSGSRSGCSSNHSRRRLRMSERSCSMAWPVFFPCQTVAHEEAVKCAITEHQALGTELTAKFLGGDVRCRLTQRHDQILAGFDPPRTPITAQGPRARVPMFSYQLPPPAHARRTHAKTRHRLAVVRAIRNRLKNTNTKI